MRSFKSNENIHKKEDGSYYVVSANKCETKLKDNKSSSSFHVNGVHPPFRKDHNSNGGGFILVYVSLRNQILETDDIACLWIEIIPEKGRSFLLGSLYRNPTERVEWIDRFEKFLWKLP